MTAEGETGLPGTIPAVVHRAAERWPDDEAIVDGEVRLTFRAFESEVQRAARAFVASGLQPGDRATVWAPNTYKWMIAAFGLYTAGGVLVPLNTRFLGNEAAHVLSTSGARFLFTATDFLGTNYVDCSRVPACATWWRRSWCSTGPTTPAPPGGTTSSRGEQVDASEVAREAAISPEDMSDIIFTSGTTGKPKGAMLRHDASVRAFARWAEVVGLRHGDRYLCVYPFFHTAGLKSGIVASLLTGTTLYPAPGVRRAVGHAAHRRGTHHDAAGAARRVPDHPQRRLVAVRLQLAAPRGHRRRGGPGRARGADARAARDSSRSSPATASPRPHGIISMCHHDDDPEIIAHTSGRPLPGLEGEVDRRRRQHGADRATG